MIKKYFKCTLLTDVVFNGSLATEGNMKTLDYIPGSIFLGIVAAKYKSFTKADAYNIFHSGKVSFGDAHIAIGDFQSYAMPFSLFQDKLKDGIPEYKVFVNPDVNNSTPGIRWEQHRGGYFNSNNDYVKKVERKFSLKSAQDRDKRKSKDQAMFGFESLQKAQQFIFSVDFETTDYVEEVIRILTDGTKRVGKSKTAQYGQVEIKEITAPVVFSNGIPNERQLTVYAESNLCFLNEYGQATFQPSTKNFGIKGKVDWQLTQIRTYSYSPWNFHRNTTNTQRDCILKGSVIVFILDEEVDVEKLSTKVGEYKEEGLGRVIYNPDFLDFKEDGQWNTKLKKYKRKKNKPTTTEPTTNLGIFLKRQATNANKELQIGKAVQRFMNDTKTVFDKITSSQWGVIRSEAIQAKDNDALIDRFFSKDSGVLVKGVAAEMYWDKNNGKARNILQETMEQDGIRDLGTKFIAKLATEMAKQSQKNKTHDLHT